MLEQEVSNKRGTLAGKIALVTGGASGIGRAIALLFAREGAAVSIADLDQTGGKSLAKSIVEKGGQAVYLHCDVSLATDCQRVVEQTVDQFGSLNILSNNAGIIHRATILETTESEWDRLMEVNVKSIFMLSKHAIPIMAQDGGGVIINIASGWGLVGGRKAAGYCASKGAVVLLTKAMALDHGGQNIRVNCICPGDTDTPMLRDEAEQLGQSMDKFLAEAIQRPLKRLGSPEDIAHAALYLARYRPCSTLSR
ncbi:MAG: SDR family NAD(P)-dependent oxidoreductase [Candidatus Hodarchaeales archaeon]|jgi:NAD(P)-dependent dehydrogenase (short-subunit alcohol dehydrogenase family)